MIIGAQLYTVRAFTQTEQDFDQTIKKVKDIGYTCVQISAIGAIPAEKVREICDKYGVKIIVTHTGPARVLNDTDNVINEHKIMGAGYVGIGSMPGEYRGGLSGVKKFITDFTPAAEKIADAGLKFAYHNHNFEFEKLDGKLMIDHLADGFKPDLMGFILDTYWVQAGGADPADYLKKYAGRLEVIHFKDMKILPKQGEFGSIQTTAEILEGNLNWPPIFKACEEVGALYAFIEQDNCNGLDPFDCLETSYRNLYKYGYR